MKFVYVLIGATGEYDDYHIWYVRGYVRRQSAETAAAKLNAVAARVVKDYGKHDGSPAKALKKAGDPWAKMDYTGTWYKVHRLSVSWR